LKPRKFKRKFKPFWVTLYTDASFKNGQGSWACWIRSGKGRIVKNGPCPKEIQTSNQAELYAVFKALEIIKEELPKTVGIYLNSDSQLVCEKSLVGTSEVQGASKKWQKAIHSILIDQNWELKTKHIKAHQKVQCTRTFINNKVDELARQALPEGKVYWWNVIWGKALKWWYTQKKKRS
jgi:ribonuclease HI